MAESWTGPKFGHPTFNCNIGSSFTQRTSQSCLDQSQEPCEWVDADLGVLWVESQQILHLKVGCPNFGPARGSAIYPTYLPYEWIDHDLEIVGADTGFLPGVGAE